LLGKLVKELGELRTASAWEARNDERRTAADVDRVFHALGDMTRRAMMEGGSGRGPMSVSLLAEPFKMSLAAVVQHLQILEESGIGEDGEGGPGAELPNRIRGGSTAQQNWIGARRPEWARRLDRLEDILTEKGK